MLPLQWALPGGLPYQQQGGQLGSMSQQLPSSYQMLPPASFPAFGQLPAAPSYLAASGFQSSVQQAGVPFQGASQGLPFPQQGLPAMQIPLGYYSPTTSYHLQQMANSMWLTQQPRQQAPSQAPAVSSSEAQHQAVPVSSQAQVRSISCDRDSCI